ncbi:MAG: PIN domain-containing protein [Treponema sp.]|nr:PIN domain-containing protein [Treponema sp.]
MSAKAFIDTNIFIYLYSNDEPQKKIISQETIKKYDCIISTQVLNEFSNICFKKFNKSSEEVELALNEIIENSIVSLIDNDNIKQALRIHKQYGYNYYDCLIITMALNSNCEYLITEDMADGQVIDKMLTIVNIYSENNIKKYLD